MREYKISLIILVYNAKKYIARCLESAFNQNFQDIEYILVDDCSQDGSMETAEDIIQSFPDRMNDVRIVRHDRNRGSAAARNSGIQAASGEYVIFLDSDDYIEFSMCQDMYHDAIKESAEIVVADYFISYPTKQLYCHQMAAPTGTECARQILSGVLHGSTWNKLIKRELYTNSGIQFTEGVNMWEDMSVIPRICFSAAKVIHLPHAYLHYVQYNAESYTSNMKTKSISNICQVIGILEDFFYQLEDHSEYVMALNFLKLHAKSDFIWYTRGESRKRLMAMYPEANGHIQYHPGLSIYYKLILWLGVHHAYVLADGLKLFYLMVKKIYLKVYK